MRDSPFFSLLKCCFFWWRFPIVLLPKGFHCLSLHLNSSCLISQPSFIGIALRQTFHLSSMKHPNCTRSH